MNNAISKKIEEIFYPYVAINSEAGTPAEILAGQYFHQYFKERPYFSRHPEHLGSFVIEGDPHGRSVEWAFVKGQGPKTVVLLHHFDVVEIEDYGLFKPFAFNPAELEKALRQSPGLLTPEIREDLHAGNYIFGRGAADMKGGGAIQMALLDELSQQENLEGNLLLLAVPDEENLSLGMRSAVTLMANLKAQFGLDYVVLINSEPQFRRQESIGVLAAGAIGKILPFVYVRGILSHASLSAEGFNPLAILSEIVNTTELSLELAEFLPEAGEVTPLPTWLMVRDSKVVYDVSMPKSAFGCLNIFMMKRSPQAIMQTLFNLCAGAAATVTARLNRAADVYSTAAGRGAPLKAWETKVLTYEDYLSRLKSARGADFDGIYRKIKEECMAPLRRGEQTMAAATWAMLDRLAQLDDSNQPVVVIGLVPPIYPSLTYADRPEFSALIQHLGRTLDELATSKWQQTYRLEPYMGVSDLSYTSLNDPREVEAVVSANMPLYGDFYNVPFTALGEISMPCINVGPRGKDFHKLGERVHRQDLLEWTPEMVLTAIQAALRF